MFWLYGGAGAGKSALAQTLAEKFKKLRRLAASFFFSKTAVPTRGNGDQLVPTLVLQLLETFPDLRPLIEDQIRKYPTLFHKSRESQWETLFVEPNMTLASSKFEQGHPLLIVIDGLDECQDADVQCDLLQIIASSIPRLPFPFCFLIASRPESHIVRTFDHHRALQAINVQRYDLSRDPNVDIDIRGFLEQEFADICRVHVLGTHLRPDWPGSEAIDTLVDRSSGHFIYASTVIRYIEHPRRRPDDRLQVILGLSPASVQDRPYAQLDALYTRIFQEVEDIQVEAIRLVLSILYLITARKGLFEDESIDTSTISVIDNLLGWKPGDLDLLFDSLRSLVILDGGDFHVLHKSLFDYLLDPSRSRGFHLDLGKNHLMMNAFSLEYFYDFAYHCYFARYNAELRNYICSLDILYSHKQQLLLELSRHHGVHLPWVSALFYIFRTLRRRDLGISQTIYEAHIDEIIKLHSSIAQLQTRMKTLRKMSSFVQSLLVPAFNLCNIFKNVPASHPEHPQNLDDRLELMFRTSRPHYFTPVDPSCNLPDRDIFIRREHAVFASYMKLLNIDGEKYVRRSTYVCGEHFIHCYHFIIIKEPELELGSMTILTYARHQDASSRYNFIVSFYDSHMEYEGRILKEVEEYLEKYM